MSEWESMVPYKKGDIVINTKGEKVVITHNTDDPKQDDWETCEQSGQQRLDALGGTFWLSEDSGVWTLVNITVDAAGPKYLKPIRFATEYRAKNWVEYLIEKDEKKCPE